MVVIDNKWETQVYINKEVVFLSSCEVCLQNPNLLVLFPDKMEWTHALIFSCFPLTSLFMRTRALTFKTRCCITQKTRSSEVTVLLGSRLPESNICLALHLGVSSRKVLSFLSCTASPPLGRSYEFSRSNVDKFSSKNWKFFGETSGMLPIWP